MALSDRINHGNFLSISVKTRVCKAGPGLLALLLAACSGSNEPAAPEGSALVTPVPAAEVSKAEATINRSPNRKAYFGNFHKTVR